MDQPPTDQWVSARAAAEILEEVNLSRTQARRLLAAGFAGPGVRTRSAVLYDRGRITALSQRPAVPHPAVDAHCPHGLFVARLGPGRELDAQAPWEERCQAVQGEWDLSVWTRILVHSRAQRHGSMPLVATVSGFVAVGADIVSAFPDPKGMTVLGLAPPGSWFAAFDERRFVTGPGRSWFVWGWPPKHDA